MVSSKSKKVTVGASSVTIPQRELKRIRRQLRNPDGIYSDMEYKMKLKEMSHERAATWDNTLEALRRQKEQARKERIHEQERKMREEDAKCQARKEAERKKIVARVRKIQSEDTDVVREAKGALMMCDITKELKQQLLIKKYQKNLEKEQDQRFWEQIMQTMKEGELQELKKLEKEAEKSKEVQKVIQQQLEEYHARKNAELKEKELEGLRLRQRAEDDLKKAEAKQLETMARQKAMREEQKQWLQEQIEQKKEYLKSSEKENESIEKWAHEKEKIEKYRKEKTLQRHLAKLEQRQKLIDDQYELLMKMQSNEEERIAKQIEEAEAKEAEMEAEKQRKREELKQACLDACERQRIRHEQEKAEELAADRERLRLVDEDTQKYHESEHQKMLDAYNAAKQNQLELKRQMLEKRRREAREAEANSAYAHQVKAKMDAEDVAVSQWIQDKVQEFANYGLDVTPIVAKWNKHQH